MTSSPASALPQARAACKHCKPPNAYRLRVLLPQVHSPQAMEVKKVAGDGDCLFHALGTFDGYDGAALRIEVAGFMEVHAAEQEGFEEEWMSEAGKLRDSQWGGHTAIAAYSLMTSRRVIIHTKQGGLQMPAVQEMSHAEVMGKEDCPAVHILYNNVDHYDALIQTDSLDDMVPAWAQPVPSLYFIAREASETFPALTRDKPAPGTKSAFKAPRPARKGKPKQKATPAPKRKNTKKQQPQKPRDTSTPADESAEPKPNEDPEIKEEKEDRPGLMEALEAIPVAETSKHPHRKAEDLIQDCSFVEIFPRTQHVHCHV